MRTIDIINSIKGDILAEDILNKHGVIAVAKNTVLNSYIINKLIDAAVEKVKVYDDESEYSSLYMGSTYLQIKKDYSHGMTGIKSIIKELAAGKPLSVEKVMDVSDRVCSGIKDSCDVMRVLNEEKGFDEYTYTHSLNVAFYAMLLGKWMTLLEGDIRRLVTAGLLHDIGKTKIPIEILNKKSKLSKDEFELIKRHSLLGYELVKMTKSFQEDICESILHHHERMDKSGYPTGKRGDEIGIFARIIAVADVYDAMTSDRVYKKRQTPFEVFEMFRTTGVKNFDPKVVNAFIYNLSVCYVGSKVLLNTGEIGEIVFVPPQSATEPVISIGNEYIDLSRCIEKKIVSML